MRLRMYSCLPIFTFLNVILSFCLVQFPSGMQAYGGLGRALPINRGAGVNQKLLLDFARLVAAGIVLCTTELYLAMLRTVCGVFARQSARLWWLLGGVIQPPLLVR